jgi:membrane protease YdiL (CAAX protease family)
MDGATRTRELPLAGALAIWAGLLGMGVALGWKLGFGGARFAGVMAVCAVLLAGEIFPAAPRVREQVAGWLESRGGALAVALPLVAFFAYAAIVSVGLKLAVIGAAYILMPTLLLAVMPRRESATIVDYLCVLIVWLPVEFRWMYHLFPYPPPLTHTLTILLAVNAGLAAFLFTRGLTGVGYAADWRKGYATAVAFHFLVFAAIAIPLGEALRFIHFDPSAARLRSVPVFALGIFFFTAWPEEFLFRGLIQNLLSRSLRSEWWGLIAASFVFGASHLNNGGFPNWRYGILATIAGFFYGRAWLKTRSLLPGAIVHALVDILWHLLFR